MKLGIIGAGNIGGTLGKQWSSTYDITWGVRNPDEPKYADLAPHGAFKSIEATIQTADIVVLAVPGRTVAPFLEQYGSLLADSIVVDTTNDGTRPEMNNLDLVREYVAEANIIRAFNSLGWESFADAIIAEIQADLFFCCATEQQDLAEQLISAVGLQPIYVGSLGNASLIDNLTRLWFELVFEQGHGRRVAFKMLKD